LLGEARLVVVRLQPDPSHPERQELAASRGSHQGTTTMIVAFSLAAASAWDAPATGGVHRAGAVTSIRTSRDVQAVSKPTGYLQLLAKRAASAMSEGHAHVEPGFLSGRALDAARADMIGALSQVAPATDTEFQSIQTDLMNPDFRRQLPSDGMPFGGLLEQFDELRLVLADRTGRRLLEGGGLHLMRYPAGTKFMRHADETPFLEEPTRNSISFLLYLTPDDWGEEHGGTLRVFEGEDGTLARHIMPTGGTLVIYDSTVEHEVLPTFRERHLLSGRFRELDEHWRERQVW